MRDVWSDENVYAMIEEHLGPDAADKLRRQDKEDLSKRPMDRSAEPSRSAIKDTSIGNAVSSGSSEQVGLRTSINHV
ncbi:hypothetical protein [Methylobacterium sp. 285MFTsu5.1]|uniref:hypothetical protein n=1 Tax=Methylobacterium sp. 285MFTsu5.1 TaxID=1172187 RepID=UPI001319FDD5|nr:hypothetical protein [Methylobacterium sp. 285MFTsu5.1]